MILLKMRGSSGKSIRVYIDFIVDGKKEINPEVFSVYSFLYQIKLMVDIWLVLVY